MKLNRTMSFAAATLAMSPAFALAAEGGSGLPPAINEGIVTAIVALTVFIILLVILGKTAWGPIATGLAARERKIADDIKTAERARSEAESALQNYKKQLSDADVQVREKLASAQKDAEAIAMRLKADAQKEIEDMKSRATKELDEAKRAALSEVHAHAAQLSTAVAGKILKRQINEADQADLIRSSLEELQVAGRR